MDLIYLHTRIREVFWGFEFRNLYFFGTGKSCCIFLGGLSNKCCAFKTVSHVFDSNFLGPVYSQGTSVNTVLHYYHLTLDFC